MLLKSLCTIMILKIISVVLELSYRRICTPMDTFYHFCISMLSSSSEACGTIRTLTHHLDYVVIGMIMKAILDGIDMCYS